MFSIMGCRDVEWRISPSRGQAKGLVCLWKEESFVVEEDVVGERG